MVDIFNEVDEDLRRHQLQALWKKYGKLLIAFMVGIVVAVGGYQYWQYHTKKVQARESLAFSHALEKAQSKDRDAGLAALDKLSKTGSTGYRGLAGLREAALIAKGGDVDKALGIYDAISKDHKVDQTIRDYADLVSVSWLIDSGKDQGVSERLDRLAKPGAPWAPLARELNALLVAEKGNSEDAKERFNAIASNEDFPPGLRQRAKELAGAVTNK